MVGSSLAWVFLALPFPSLLASLAISVLCFPSSSSRAPFFDLPHSAMAGNTPGIGRIILLLLLLFLRVRALEVWFFSPTGRWSVATGARSFLSRFVPGQVSAAVAATAGGIDALLRSAFFAVLLLLLFLLSSGGPTGMSVLLLFRFLILFCFCVFTPASATFQHLIYRYAFACQIVSLLEIALRSS